MNVYLVKTGSILPLGKQGENMARKIQFDISRWISTFGPGTVQLLHQRNGDEAPYPVAVEQERDCAVWTVTNADTAAAGTGRAELQYYVGDALVKSETWMTKVLPALGPASETPPEAQQGWVDQVLAQVARITGMTAQAVELPAGSAPTADYTDGVLTIGIPLGGDVSEAQIAQAVAEYLSKNPIAETDPTVPDWAKEEKKPSYTAAEVGADPSGTAESKVAAHNTGTDTHSDIRLLIQGLTERLNTLADSDDTTLDQLSEVVLYIKSNRTLIEAITTSKVSVADIINNLTTNVTNKPLSAAQGVALKAMIDAITIPTALPNPNALTFTGAVTGSYDGSSKMSARIPQVVSWANKELFDKADLVDPGNLNSFVTVDGVEYYRYHAGGTHGFTWNNPHPLPGSVTITARGVSQYGGSGNTRLKTIYDDGTYGPDLYIVASGESKTATVTTDASKTLEKITGNYDLENWVLLDMSVMSIVANYNVGVPLADSNVPGGIKADPATETDTVPAKIGADGKLYVPDMSGGGGGIVSGDYIPVPSTAEVGQTIVVKATDENGKPTEWEAVDMESRSDGWTEIGEITLDGTAFIISDYSDGVVTISPENGVYPQVNKNTVLRKPDYSAYINVRFIETGTEGQYTMVNLDGAVYAPSDDLAQYIVDIPNVNGGFGFSELPSFSYFKVELTTPLLPIHGARSSILFGGKINYIIGPAYYSLADGPAEIVIESNESPVAGKDYVKISVKGKKAERSNGYDAIDFAEKNTKNSITISHYNELLVTGMKAKLWGRN